MRVRYPYLPIWIICGALAVMVGLCLRPGPVETPPLASEETLARLEAAGVSQEDVAHYPETVMKHLAWILEGRNIRQYQVESPGEPAMELTVFVLLDREDPERVDQVCCLGRCGWEPGLWRPEGRDRLVLEGTYPDFRFYDAMGHFGTDMTPASWLERIFGGPERTESYTHDLGRAKCDFLARGQGVILCGLLTQGTMTPAEAEGALENFCLRYIGQDGQETFVTLEH